jgi:hypothetical protein
MKIYMPVGLTEEVMDGLFDFRNRMIYSSLAIAMEVASESKDGWIAIMEGELLNEDEIKECVCQSLIGNTYTKFHVKWTASYIRKPIAA